MSGIAAIYDRAGASVGREELLPLLDSISHRGDREEVWFGASLAIGRRSRPTTPEARDETLPIAVAAGRYQIALDGRIDNREELFDALGRTRQELGRLSDADLIALAFERWGSESFARLLGDFAFLLWSAEERRLYAVRDQRGFRPLYYAQHSRRLILGSEPEQLLAQPGVPRSLDALYLACHLTGAHQQPGSTPYASVSEVPAAHYLVAQGDGLALHEYWRFGPREPLRYRRREDYVAHLEEVFAGAVKAAVRAEVTPAILLSGGLDSSYVASHAVDHAPGLTAYNAFVAGADGMDERDHARAVAARLGIALTEIDVSDCWSLSSAYLSDAAFDQPAVPMQAPLQIRLAQAAAADGVTVLLDGIGGDEFMTGSYDYLADLVGSLHWLHAARDARSWGARADLPASRVLFYGGVLPLVPMGLRKAYRSLRRRRRPAPWPPWIDPEVLKVCSLGRALEVEPLGEVGRHGDEYETFWAFHTSDGAAAWSWRERHALVPARVEARSPFWDLRVVELMLRIPAWVTIREGQPKALLRDAMRQRLPDQVTDRPDKGTFDVLMNRGLLQHELGRSRAALTGPIARLLYVKEATLQAEFAFYMENRHRWWHPLWRAVVGGLFLQREASHDWETGRSVGLGAVPA